MIPGDLVCWKDSLGDLPVGVVLGIGLFCSIEVGLGLIASYDGIQVMMGGKIVVSHYSDFRVL